jgi:hypothetical protein
MAKTGADVKVRTSARANNNPCPPPRSRQQSDVRKDSKDACSHPDMSVQNSTDSQIRLSLYWRDKLTMRGSHDEMNGRSLSM